MHYMNKVSPQDQKKEARGWLILAFTMFLFPILFFACVFFPLFVGLTPRWP